MDGEFEGIGARVGLGRGADTLVITEPFENQPAWQAGLRRDDLIVAVDGESIEGYGLADAVEKIRGPKGSTVILTVQSPAHGPRVDVEVVRDSIDIPTISARTMGDAGDVAYVRLNSFNENAGALVREAVRDAMQRDPRAIMLDLRGNSGGLLREAVRSDQRVSWMTRSCCTSDSTTAEWRPIARRARRSRPRFRWLCWSTKAAPAPVRLWPARCRITTARPSSARIRTARVPCNCRTRCPTTASCASPWRAG